MKVGQRAYLNISQGELRVHGNASIPDVLYAFSLNNLGNTPAKINSMRIDYDLPKGWEVRPQMGVSRKNDRQIAIDKSGMTFTSLGDIGPKISEKISGGALLRFVD